MSSNLHILVIEDEQDIRDILTDKFAQLGHKVTTLSDGGEVIPYLNRYANRGKMIDLCVLDRMLPRVSGIEICKYMRNLKKTATMPILMLTARVRPQEVIEGLEAGADDYVTKPFDLNVLCARINVLVRRVNTVNSLHRNDQDILTSGAIKLDPQSQRVWLDGREIMLTLSEYRLLLDFLYSSGRVRTRKQLIGAIQDVPVHVTHRTIDTHIASLRKKLKDCACLIETIRGVGLSL